MGYLEEFQKQIKYRNFQKFMQLWEEYCTNETVEFEEFRQLLCSIKGSALEIQVGQIADTALPIWDTISDKEESYEILRLLIDLQTTNSPQLAEAANKLLKEKYGDQTAYKERLRLIGLRPRGNFNGAISHYDLLNHMKKGKCVFHTGGWGTGEIMDVSPLREQLTLEFEGVPGLKNLSYANAFNMLVPLQDESFLARRFANPDDLEKEARENPVAIFKLMLKDLGPLNATEIKDELCELVIPEKEWGKWWQAARAKIKKDTMIETPSSLKDPFKLRKKAVTHEERLHSAIKKEQQVDELIHTAYSFVRDYPAMLKKADIKANLKEKLTACLEDPHLDKAHEMQILIFFEHQFGEKVEGHSAETLVRELDNILSVIEAIEILAFKKKVMILVKKHRDDWQEIFLDLLMYIPQAPLKDYLLKELNQGNSRQKLEERISSLMQDPLSFPETFVWYFQKLTAKNTESLPFGDKQGRCEFFEALLILFSMLDTRPAYKDLSKKIYNLLLAKRFAVVRQMIEGTSLEFINEFLLLVSKCQALTNHDLKIMRALAEVVHPSLNTNKRHGSREMNGHEVWTTEKGYQKVVDRLEKIHNVEMVETAREIEAARALGDLRENSEYKFAIEKRNRLQAEMRHLSHQLSRARLITQDDISSKEVGIGSTVEIADSNGKKVVYTILGPWEADPDQGVLSFQSKLVQAMMGLKPGENFNFKDDNYQVISVRSYLEK